jgi:hypothetical protein
MSARAGGVMTERWGWQPTARIVAGLPAWSYRGAPRGLLTRRQMRAEGLAPGGSAPVGLIVWRRGQRWAHLWDRADLRPKRTASPAQLAALGRALAARQRCPTCHRDVGYCLPRRFGECIDCAERAGVA